MQVSLLNVRGLPDHSVTNHLTPSRHRFNTLPFSVGGLPLSGPRLRHWLAGSPQTSGRIVFVILRTGRSPPVALHLASRRRSYFRLQAGERMPEEDFHLPECARSQAHDSATSSPRDLSLGCESAKGGKKGGGARAAHPCVFAPQTALGSRPRVALSSAAVRRIVGVLPGSSDGEKRRDVRGRLPASGHARGRSPVRVRPTCRRA